MELKSSDSGNMVRIENRLNALDKAVEDVQKEIKTCENEIKNAKQEYEKPFPYEELLKENITRQMEIDAELEIKDQEECMEYNIRVYKPELKQEEGKINNLRGFATITFDEDFCVKSLAIKESSKGNLYLDMPRYRDYETGEYVPFYRFTDKEFQKEVLDTVREAYENMTETKIDCKGSWGEEELYYNLSVNPVQGSDTFKADVAIRLQDVLAIQQLHVIQAWNGKTFVGMPQKNSAKGEREDIAHAVNAEFKADLESAIMDEYNKKMEYAKSQKQQRIGR